MPIHVKVLSQADYTAWVDGEKKEMPRPGRRSEQGLGAGRPGGARREGLRRQLRGLPPAQRQGRRPIKPLDGSPVVLDADKAKQIHVVLNGAEQRRDAGVEAAVATPSSPPSSPSPRTTGRTRPGQLVQPTEVAAARK